jgi:Spy/CpxP family protein refolding chaperone
MKDNILKYILIVSLLMNFSLLGAAGYTHYRQMRLGPPFAGPAGFQGKPGPLGAGMQPGCLFEELSLKPEQAKLFQQKALMFHESLDKRRREVDQLRGSLIALMRSDKPDSKEVDATISRINAIQEDMQKTVVSHMLEFKSMLNKDQQKKFLDLIQSATGQRGEAVCP